MSSTRKSTYSVDDPACQLDPVVVGHQVAGQEGPPGEGPLPRTLDSGAVHVHRLSLVRLCRDIGNK